MDEHEGREDVTAIINGILDLNRRLEQIVVDVGAIRELLEDDGEEGAEEDQDR